MTFDNKINSYTHIVHIKEAFLLSERQFLLVLTPKTIIGHRNLTFWGGGHTSKIFDLSNCFKSIDFKIATFLQK